MKHRVNLFAKRIGSSIGKPIDVNKQKLIEELSPFVLPRSDGKAGLLVEEVLELTEAIECKDVVKVLDAVVDIEYFLHQMIAWLEKSGIDYKEACDRVCNNNDDKYSTSLEFIQAKLIEWQVNDPWFAERLHIAENFVDGETFYCLKDDNDKVRKFVDFEGVELESCVPVEFINVKPTWDSFFKTRFEKISTQEEYNALKCSGMAYEVEPELEDTWQEFCVAKEQWLNSKLEG